MEIQSSAAARNSEMQRGMPNALKLLLSIGLLAVLGCIALAFHYFVQGGVVHFTNAYRVVADSMCPTLCAGERVLADSAGYASKPPQRGDLVIFNHEKLHSIFIKRVAGVAGDTVSSNDDGDVLVNGKLIEFPPACGSPVQPARDADIKYPFDSTVVPQGELFVVGDHLANSNDSRFEEFGNVTLKEVLGKPTFIYWSPGHGRFGCRPR